ncbi:hypothetical protein A2276_02655 [candidate division WOR-1 bacterium RIFOXYA12_FULL_43_27]|uniref:Schlafen AlbA-2 domain-containing protein n=1 Tax=candidate division WOR-1 bacterium RIFOXYC2_FULL_46_14 TaxID=1802587 RepID=A0A1F4U7P5_UNCSA|nr:MAG: hypothetical protein A2276_02655 [candidate division WOR-1 bacterium RIFOXYA12_FULL_43_27]OGC19389.1 MAG: hypothetical protein A2292_01675 [candidate division WOR-1 bacterium RIFOXYB2_FULL_46_45]OGC30378.1 MAG: hypothetical protein A2232_01675 [candidate division WOR-1 bacterium RIFOXYA2_FULL_46_56]OGC40978.1 MAG: hypothetical protein A2438_01675 [candidate division WOR-1 bacterium RIFOXYC2_FULL_46_14]
MQYAPVSRFSSDERVTDIIIDNSDPKIYPEITSAVIGAKHIIVIRVNESHDKPHLYQGRAFIRVGKNTKPMSRNEYERLLIKRSRTDIRYDKEECAGAKLKDIDWPKVKWFKSVYKDISGKDVSSSDQKLLEGLGCVRNSRVLNSGMLLFGKEPDKFIPQNQVTIVRYPGENIADRYLDIKDFYGNLFDLIDKADEYIKEHIQISSHLVPGKIPREEVPEYPLYAIRELIVNAVAHRDYFISGSRIIIKMFKGRIEYSSPGGLPEGITPKNMINKQSSRNPTLVKVLNRVKYIEAIGDGINRIHDAVKDHPLKPKMPVFDDVGGTVIVTLFGADLNKIEKEEPMPGLNERQKKTLNYIREKGKIFNREYQEINATTKITAARDLASLVVKKICKKVGKGRGTYYVLFQ